MLCAFYLSFRRGRRDGFQRRTRWPGGLTVATGAGKHDGDLGFYPAVPPNRRGDEGGKTERRVTKSILLLHDFLVDESGLGGWCVLEGGEFVEMEKSRCRMREKFPATVTLGS
ncbi:unnamed protein product [Linum trigynum]|uniref:Uncharacterized protein n=1 Tax=Linum trigynum TaxID=586398 RepID=A0AAV2EM53_9ROSI